MMFAGNGQTGPFDRSPEPAATTIEAGVEELTRTFHDRLQRSGSRALRRLRARDARLAVLEARPAPVDRPDHDGVRRSRACAPADHLHLCRRELLRVRLARCWMHRRWASSARWPAPASTGSRCAGAAVRPSPRPLGTRPGGFYRIATESGAGGGFRLQQALHQRAAADPGPARSLEHRPAVRAGERHRGVPDARPDREGPLMAWLGRRYYGVQFRPSQAPRPAGADHRRGARDRGGSSRPAAARARRQGGARGPRARPARGGRRRLRRRARRAVRRARPRAGGGRGGGGRPGARRARRGDRQRRGGSASSRWSAATRPRSSG